MVHYLFSLAMEDDNYDVTLLCFTFWNYLQCDCIHPIGWIFWLTSKKGCTYVHCLCIYGSKYCVRQLVSAHNSKTFPKCFRLKLCVEFAGKWFWHFSNELHKTCFIKSAFEVPDIPLLHSTYLLLQVAMVHINIAVLHIFVFEGSTIIIG